MAQTLGNTRVLALAFLAAAPAWATGPAAPVQGQYRGAQGSLRFSPASGGAIRGVAEGGGACNWTRGDVIFDGAQEGSVLVGQLKICQTGPGCGIKTLPVMVIHEPGDNVLSAHLPPEGGCQATGLKDRMYLLTGVASGQVQVAQAQQVAARLLSREDAQAAEKAFLAAGKYLNQRQYRKAADEYERGLRFHPSNYAAHIQLGVARMKLGEPELALNAYANARTFAPEAHPVIHYNMACAHARLKNREQALAQLKLAVEHGFNNADVMQRDPDLNALFGEDEAFLALTAAARAQKRGK